MTYKNYCNVIALSIFAIKCAEDQTGEIKIKCEGEDITITSLGISKTTGEANILNNIKKEVLRKVPFFKSKNYFISELKIGEDNIDVNVDEQVKIEKDQKADIVLKKCLKVKEIKFNDTNLKQDLTKKLKDDISNIFDWNKDFTYKSLFESIKKVNGLFKKKEFGIKLNNIESTNDNEYKGDDKLNEGEEITIVLDNTKLKENAFSKFIIEGDENIFDIDYIKKKLEEKKIDNKTKINQIFSKDIFPNEFDVYMNDDNTLIKSYSTDSIPKGLKYFRIEIDKNNINLKNNDYLKCNVKLKLCKNGCEFINENILKSLETIFDNFSFNKIESIVKNLKKSYFIDKNIDKTKISVKNQDTSDDKEYNNLDGTIPPRIILGLYPEAFIKDQVKCVFTIADVEKDGKKLKDDFKNKFSKKDEMFLTYGDNKTTLINLIKNIIPEITEGDIKLNGQPLPNEIKEGGVISIPADKIPNDKFEEKDKPKDTQGGDNGTGSTSTDSDNEKGEEKNKKYYNCGKN